MPLDADALMQSAVESVGTTAATHGVALGFAPSGVRVQADADRMVQVLVNLVGNAIKFTPNGKRIDVTAARDGAMVRFNVTDQGRGVPDAQKDRIFERFAQVEPGDKHEKGGAGLGLTICRAIVTAHGGRIWVEDAPGGGSVFSFTLPAA
jgi:signal transduction histidine kinase